MEDPWAAGPSWSTPAKLSQEIDENRQKATPPPEELSADPWGAGSSKVDSGPSWGDDRPRWEASVSPVFTGAGRDHDEAYNPADLQSSPNQITRTTSKELDLHSPKLASDDSPGATSEATDEGRNAVSIDAQPVSEPNEVSLNDESTPAPSHSSIPDEVDPEAQFLSALKISSPKPSFSAPHSPAKSPVYSDGGFGGFSSNADPWGGGAGVSEPMPSWGGGDDNGASFSPVLDGEVEDDTDGWGGASSKNDVDLRPRTQDNDWEEAQRAMRLRADRVPEERIRKLKADWTDIAETLPGRKTLDKFSEEEEGKLEQGVSAMQDEVREALRSLSSIPADISTYPPVISSLTTHERHVYALSRPNPVPSTSLLNVSLARRSRRIDALSSSSPWLSRSRLGEPEASQAEPAAPSMSPDDPKSRWSFWGRKTTPKPLITSGGSILEVKSPPVGESVRASGSGEMTRSASRTPSISVSNKSSRPASPAPPPMASPQQPPLPSVPDVATHESVGHAAPSGALGTQTPQGPSAMSRFFGRLGRKPSSRPSADLDANDLQLTSDDFNFLQEVPSLGESSSMGHGIGDLLSLESGRSEEIAGLESMLASKPAAVPPPLAPPPQHTVSRVPSGGPSGHFVARMKAPAATDMDLLGGLDFDSDASGSPTTSLRDNTTGTQSMWDSFLDSGPSNTAHQASQALRKSTSSPISPPPLPSLAPANISAASIPMRIAFDPTPTPKPSTSTSMDDFGDFTDFASSTAPGSSTSLATPASMSRNHSNLVLQSPPPLTHIRGPSVDHSSTMNLMSGASALKGRRWPAPPSPAAPNLDPPPRPSNQRQSSGGFPFLSPPPPPRPASGLGISQNLLDDGDFAQLTPKATSPPATLAVQQNSLSPPNGSRGPLETGNKPSLSAGTNLTATDLSFFDSL